MPAEIEQPTVIDAMAEDAAPREFPPGAPALWPYLKLPFRKRSQFFRQYKELGRKQAELAEFDKAHKRRKNKDNDTEFLLEQATMLYDLYGIMDEMMQTAAVDITAYTTWVENADDEEFAKLFQVYVERSQPGEASGSAS